MKKASQDVGVEIDAPVSLTNEAPERFELTCVKASQTSSESTRSANTTYDRASAAKTHPRAEEDSTIKVPSHKIVDSLDGYSCKSVNRSSRENDPAFPEAKTSTASSISLDSVPEKNTNKEVGKNEDGVRCSENDRSKVQESTKSELRSSMKLKAKNSETHDLFPTDTRCQENVLEDLLPGATSKQEPCAYDDDEDEDETGSLVELCLDKIDEASDESSHGSMEIHSEEEDDDGSKYDKRGFLCTESDQPPLGATCLTVAANRKTARSTDSEDCFPSRAAPAGRPPSSGRSAQGAGTRP